MAQADLVFYNYILKCFVLIDLKTDKITHQDVGQMDMYIRMYDELKKGADDNPTLGIVLCTETDEDIARYSVLHGNERLFASKYKLYLPTEHCTRQLHYSLSNENSIDIVLFVNGIPVVSMELKCQFTGQSVANAIEQYKFDRRGKDAIFTFKERVLVHFAVDLTQIYMTTRLEGEKTYFLPFNQGSNGAGRVGGKGNPVNESGYDTAYL